MQGKNLEEKLKELDSALSVQDKSNVHSCLAGKFRLSVKKLKGALSAKANAKWRESSGLARKSTKERLASKPVLRARSA